MFNRHHARNALSTTQLWPTRRGCLHALAALCCAATLAGCLDPAEDGNLVPLTVTDDPRLPSLRLNGTAFHAESFGPADAPTIVVLHGGPGGDYRGLLRLRRAVDGRRLEDDHQLVFWDQRGSGLSQRHDAADVTLELFDRDLQAVIEHYSPDAPVLLLGHSWGGMYAAFYISKHPEDVAGAVLMEPGPLTGKLFEEVADEIVNIDLFGEETSDFLWSQRLLSPDDHARYDYFMALGALSHAQPAYHMNEADPFPMWRIGGVVSEAIQAEGVSDGVPNWDFTQGLDSFEPPVLLEASELDTALGRDFQERQAAFFKDAEVVLIKDAGHDHPWSQPEASLRPVFAYLEQIQF